MPDNGERRLYATWRNPDGLIRPVGVLTRRATANGESYRFVYLKAAETFSGFHRLPGLPDLHRVYESERLFPVFRNRLMPRRRPDYGDFVQRLALDAETDPFEVLIRSEGWRATDRIEVFAHPERAPDGALTTLFFVRGIRHRDGARGFTGLSGSSSSSSTSPARTLSTASAAILVSTRTGHRVGWVPDCLLDTIHELAQLGAAIEVTAEHVNPATSPPHMRLLCRLRAPWPDGYEPLTGPDYQPIAS